MTLLTALEIANNYPSNTRILVYQLENSKWTSILIRLKDGFYHKDLISFDPSSPFDSEQEAKDAMISVVSETIKALETQ